MSSSENYKKRIYAQYHSLMNSSPTVFNRETAKKWGEAYKTYFRGWFPLKKEAAILDVACGSGKLMYFFSLNGFHNVEGVDISKEQIDIAQQVFDRIYHGDAITFLEQHNETYDLITGIDIVEHFSKEEVCRFLKACNGALKKNGRLILQTPNADSFFGMSYRYGDFTHEVCFNMSSLSQILKIYGFNNISAREAGPYIHGVISFFRFILWRILRNFLALWNMIETGDRRSNIYTRVFLISAIKV